MDGCIHDSILFFSYIILIRHTVLSAEQTKPQSNQNRPAIFFLLSLFLNNIKG